MSGMQKRKRLSILAIILAVIAVSAVANGPAAQRKESAKHGGQEGYLTGADGVQVFYRRFGNNPDFVIFLHGGPGLSMGDGGYAMVPLGERHSLILYDQRGGGRSTLVQDPALLTAAADVRDLEELRKHFGAEKVTLVGLSWGSGLAALYAEAHPDRVSRIVFLDPMPIALKPFAQERGKKIQSLIGAEDIARLQEIEKQSEGASDDKMNALCREELRIFFRPYIVKPAGESNWEEMCDVPAAAMRNVAVVNQSVNGSLGDFDLRPTLAKLKVPVLVVEGEQTNVPLDSTREWAKTPPGARLLLIPNCGHASFIDQPETVLREIEVFMKGGWPATAKEIAMEK